MDRRQTSFNDNSSPFFSIDRSGENKIRSSKNRGRGNFFSPYNSSPIGGQNTNLPGYSSGQESPDFIPFGFSSPKDGYGSRRGRGQWNRCPGHKLFYGHNGGQGGIKGNMSPYQSSRGSYASPYRGKRGDKTNPGRGADISLYYHHSMVEDPWAELEEKLNISSPKADSKRLSDGNKVIVPVGYSLSDSDSVASTSCINVTYGSQGDESVESVSDELSS